MKRVRKSDIDTNQHVNNTKYVDWMLEALPGEVYDNYKLASLEVEYKKEVSYGFMVSSQCSNEKTADSGVDYGHRVLA